MASGPITSCEIDGETMGTVSDYFFLAPKSMQMVTAAMKLKTLTPWKESYDQPRWHIQKQRHILPTKVRLVKAMVLQWSCMDVKVGL